MARIQGNDFDNNLHGTDDDDVIHLGGGDDRASGWKGDDAIYGGHGSDTLYGNEGNDRLYGGPGIDLLYGGPGNDVLVGGGYDADLYWGGTGADRFVFEDIAPANSAYPLIADFEDGSGDRIDVSVIDADIYRTGNQAFVFLGTGAFTGRAGEMRYSTEYIGQWQTFLEMDRNGDGRADFTIQATGYHTIDRGDVIL